MLLFSYYSNMQLRPFCHLLAQSPFIEKIKVNNSITNIVKVTVIKESLLCERLQIFFVPAPFLPLTAWQLISYDKIDNTLFIPEASWGQLDKNFNDSLRICKTKLER